MMRTALTFCLAVALGLVVFGTAAHADKLKHVTCAQFLAMEPGAQDDIVYWARGVAAGADNKEVAAEEVDVGYDAFGVPVAEVVTACKADKKASLWDKIKAHFK